MSSTDQSLLSQLDLLEIIQTQTKIVQAGMDLGEVINIVVNQSQRLTRSAGAVIELVEGDEMVYRATSGIAKSQLGLRIKVATSLSGLCIKEQKILYSDDTDTDDRVDKEACRRVGLKSMLVVPLYTSQATVGVIKVLSDQTHAFHKKEAQILQLMSELVAASMSNAVKYGADEIYHRATHDALTGLANRALFFDRLRQGIAHAKRYQERIGILNMDMDGLKPINDNYGHRAGDAAIRELARRLNEACRQTDTAARMGGDEFSIILSRIGTHQDVVHYCKRLQEKISADTLSFENHKFNLAASIGFSIYPDDATEMEPLLEKADQSMYASKRERKLSR